MTEGRPQSLAARPDQLAERHDRLGQVTIDLHPPRDLVVEQRHDSCLGTGTDLGEARRNGGRATRRRGHSRMLRG